MKYKCKYHKECVPPKDKYRCNVAYEHCLVFKSIKRSKGLEPKLQKEIK